MEIIKFLLSAHEFVFDEGKAIKESQHAIVTNWEEVMMTF